MAPPTDFLPNEAQPRHSPLPSSSGFFGRKTRNNLNLTVDTDALFDSVPLEPSSFSLGSTGQLGLDSFLPTPDTGTPRHHFLAAFACATTISTEAEVGAAISWIVRVLRVLRVQVLVPIRAPVASIRAMDLALNLPTTPPLSLSIRVLLVSTTDTIQLTHNRHHRSHINNHSYHHNHNKHYYEYNHRSLPPHHGNRNNLRSNSNCTSRSNHAGALIRPRAPS